MKGLGGNVTDAFQWLSDELSNILEIDSDDEDLPPITPVPLNEFESWSQYAFAVKPLIKLDDEESYNIGKFDIDESLNSKFHFADCYICNLQVDALICIIDDAFNCSSTLRSLIKYGGYNFRDSITKLNDLKAGQAFVVRCHNVAFHHVIFSISPKYTQKYHRSSCNTLNMSIRECIKLAVEKGFDNIAFEFHPVSEHYFPIEYYSQTLLRCLRRWISMDPIINNIKKIFLVGDRSQLNTYHSTMPLYFPRNTSEINNVEMGNNYGELEVGDRCIKIASGGNNLLKLEDPTFHSTTFKNGSKRRTRSEQIYYAKKSGDWEGDEEAQFSFHTKIARAFNARGHFDKFNTMQFISFKNTDKHGRILFCADMSRLPRECDYNELVHYLLYSFQINGKFTLLLANCDTATSLSLGIALFKDVFEIWGSKRLSQLSQLLIHKSNYMIRGVLLVLYPFIPPKVWDTSIHIQEYRELLEYVDANVLHELMSFIIQ